MAEQIRRAYTKGQLKREQAKADDLPAKPKEVGEKLKAEMDDLLDEIDAVLEEDTALLNYRQQGGQ